MTGQKRDVHQWLARAIPRDRTAIDLGDWIPAAVLVPVVPREDAARLILTRRAMSVATHKGQISFPGGTSEAGDTDAAATALREAHEEIGLPPTMVSVLGSLDDYVTITGFRITPLLGIVEPTAVLTPDPAEVDEVFEVALDDLRRPEVHAIVTDDFGGIVRSYHAYTVGERVIWGATAAILHRVLSRIQ